jgi:arabinofuranan 3-O-arabinosyltransferase
MCSAALGLICAYVALLAQGALNGLWILDKAGNLIPADFVGFWSTSLQLQAGSPADVYDWTLHRAWQATVLAPGYHGYFGWFNPPSFLLAISLLAFLPYPAAFLTWIGVTLIAYLAAIRTIIPSRWALMGACGFPATFWTIGVGQNGLLTAALVGGTLGLIERRPVLAGTLLGLLTYKPQFGILFPIVLLATARWWVIGAACVTTLLLVGLSAAVFGLHTWLAFWDSITLTQNAVLTDGQMGFGKLQSFYGAVLWMGGSVRAAWIVQGSIMVGLGTMITWIWRSSASAEVKAAALGTGVLLASPYAFIYDAPVLAVPMAFLIRAGCARGFMRGEIPLLAASCALVLIFPLTQGPLGLAAECLVAMAVARRMLGELEVGTLSNWQGSARRI